MKLHELKCWPEPFTSLQEGTKTAEFRRDDGRDFEVNDILWLREWVPEQDRDEPPGTFLDDDEDWYTGESLMVQVTCVESGAFGIPDGYVQMSVRLVELVES